MDLVPGLHHLLLEIKKDLGEARLFFCEREDGFIDDLQPEGGTDTFTAAVGHVEANACIGAWFVDSGIGCGFDLQLIRGLDEDEAMVGDGLGVPSEEISIDVESTRPSQTSR